MFVLFSPLSLSLPIKLALVSPNGEQYDSLLRQLRDRMEEGCGETIYVVGMGSGEKTAIIYILFDNFFFSGFDRHGPTVGMLQHFGFYKIAVRECACGSLVFSKYRAKV